MTQQHTDVHYSPEQQYAIDLCTDLTNRIVTVTGEAGTGKTTILRAVYDELSSNSALCLAAPTGRAAKRITEATGIPARTIHRMLRYSMPVDDDEHGLPAYSKSNPMPYDVVFLDESSMINEELYRAIIDAMKPGSHVRFFGDPNQLPPVKGASPFLRLIAKYPTAPLTQNFRSGDGIVEAARTILRNRIPSTNEQFRLISVGGGLFETLDKLLDPSFMTEQSQLITAQNVGKFGTRNLNAYIQTKYNASAHGTTLTFDDDNGREVTRMFKVGDKIIWTKNDYRLNLFNGMIGTFEKFDDEGFYEITIDGKPRVIPPLLEAYDAANDRKIFQYDPRRNIDLAYAITTHKAQGSEFDRVLLVLVKSFTMNRQNFYTAVTRAKRHIEVLHGIGGLACAMRRRSMLEMKEGV